MYDHHEERRRSTCTERVAKYCLPPALSIAAGVGTAYGYVTAWGVGSLRKELYQVPNEAAAQAYLQFLNQVVTQVATHLQYVIRDFIEKVLNPEENYNLPLSQVFNSYANGTISGEYLLAQAANLSAAANSSLTREVFVRDPASIPVGIGLGVATAVVAGSACIAATRRYYKNQSAPSAPVVERRLSFPLLLNEERKHVVVRTQNIPNGFECPLSLQIMKDPVMAADGHSYERVFITRLFTTAQAAEQAAARVARSPFTRAPFAHRNLIPNITLRKAIESFLEQHPECRD